jgi:hypothetical protein
VYANLLAGLHLQAYPESSQTVVIARPQAPQCQPRVVTICKASTRLLHRQCMHSGLRRHNLRISAAVGEGASTQPEVVIVGAGGRIIVFLGICQILTDLRLLHQVMGEPRVAMRNPCGHRHSHCEVTQYYGLCRPQGLSDERMKNRCCNGQAVQLNFSSCDFGLPWM